MGNLNFSYNELRNSFRSNKILGNMFKLKYNIPNSIFWQIDKIKESRGIVPTNTFEEASELELKLRTLDNNTSIYNGESFPFSEMMDTIYNIYGKDDNKPVHDATLYDRVQIDVITEYVGIGELREFFTPYYLFIEWQMHMEWKDKGKMHSDWNYYRDHWIHQIRVMYSSLELLNVQTPTFGGNQSLADKIIKNVKTSNINVDKYIHEQATKERQRIKDTQSLNELFEDLFKYSLQGNVLSNHAPSAQQEYLNDQFYDYIVRYILNSAIMMAGIFHDIGYPIQHMRTHRHALQDVVINAPLFGTLSSHFSEFEDDLSTSLLFQIVGREDMKARFDSSEDHGILSALAFLMFMHENGLVYKLPAAQQAAVELAALIIYDHTNTYIEVEPIKKRDKVKEITKYQTPVYLRNSLSYILRFCDDIQEWDRMYFKITKNQHLLFCPKCKKPIINEIDNGNRDERAFIQNRVTLAKKIKKEIKHIEDEAIDTLIDNIFKDMDDDKDNGVTRFKCMCVHPYEAPVNGSVSYRVDKMLYHSETPHRHLNYINACNNIYLYDIKPSSESDDEELDFLPFGYIPIGRVQSAHGAFILNMNYDPWKLLTLSLIEPTFGSNRAKEINKTRRYLKAQGSFPRIIVYSVPTQNPITQKVRLLENFLKLTKRSTERPPHLVTLVDNLYNNLRQVESLADSYNLEGCNFTKGSQDLKFTITHNKESMPNTFIYSENQINELVRNITIFIDTNIENRGYPANIDEKLSFYLWLLIVSRYLGKLLLNFSIDDNIIRQISKSFCDNYPELVGSFKSETGSDSLECLIKDFFANELRHVDYYTLASNLDEFPKKYYELFEKDVDQYIKDYTLPEYYLRTFVPMVTVPEKYDIGKIYLDMHSDLYFFKTLSEYETLYNKLKETTDNRISSFNAK